MALVQATTINTLHKLIELVTSKQSQAAAVTSSASKAAAVAALRKTPYQSVNHFAVFASLEGIVEKLEVFGYDALAEALQKLVQESREADFKWLPEVLSFLIQLSERPERSAGLDKVTSLRTCQSLSGSSKLSWTEVWGNFEWKIPGEDVDYSRQTSDDCSASRSRSHSPASPQTFEPLGHNSNANKYHCTQYVLQPGTHAVSRVKDLCEHRHSSMTKTASCLSELHVTSQILKMLKGLPNDTFTRKPGIDALQIKPDLLIDGIDSNTLHSILQSYIDTGSAMQRLRDFLSNKPSTCTARAFTACTKDAITNFDSFLYGVEGFMISSTKLGHCSLLSLLQQTIQASELPLRLERVLGASLDGSELSPVRLIDNLFDETCTVQEKSTTQQFLSIRYVFLKSLQTYLRSISNWNLSGQLDRGEHSFRKKSLGSTQILSTWPQKFDLLKLETQFCAPKCLAPVIDRLLHFQRDVLLLQALMAHTGSNVEHFNPSTLTGFQLNDNTNGSIPFQLVFRNALENWIHSQPIDTSRLVCRHLLDDCNGWQVLKTLTRMYLGVDAIVLHDLTRSIWTALDQVSATSQVTCTLLTDDIRLILRDSGALTACTVKAGWSDTGQNVARNRLTLPQCITFEFEYPDLVKLLIRPDSIDTYQETFVFILQLSRCSRALSRLLPRPSLQDRKELASSGTHSRNTRCVLSLRFSLLWFLNILIDHVTNVVIIPLVEELYKLWGASLDQGALTTAHDNFTKLLATRLFQLKPDEPIRRIVRRILDLALSFSDLFSKRKQATSPKQSQSHEQVSQRDEYSGPMKHMQDPNNLEFASLYTQYQDLLRLLVAALRDKTRREKCHTVFSLIDRLEGR